MDRYCPPTKTFRPSNDPPPSFRTFAEKYCGLELSPLVGAIIDASEGTAEGNGSDRKPRDPDSPQGSLSSRDVGIDFETHFGCTSDGLPKAPPRTIVVRAGGRGGKTSRLVAPKALHAAWTVPLPMLGRGEEAYSLLIAPDLKLARQALSFCKGYVDGSPVLKAALVCDPTQDEITLRRPDGKVCKVSVAAASRGGRGGRGKSLVFAGMDEACFFRDEATGVANDSEIYRAVLQRIVPHGQCWVVSTPWVTGVGLLEDLLSKYWGDHDNALCVVAPTRSLNPNWDPTGEISQDLQEQDPDAYEREVLAIPLTAGSQQFFSYEAIKQSVNQERPQKLPRESSSRYFFGGDMGFKRNSSALVIVEHAKDRYRVACIEELKPTPGLPLKPAGVVDAFAVLVREYGGHGIVVDSHERDAVSLELARHTMSAIEAPDKVESYIAVRKLFHEGKVELPKHPRLVSQLRDIVSKPTPGGGLSITSPKKADGSHGDLVSALVLAVWQAFKSTRFAVSANGDSPLNDY